MWSILWLLVAFLFTIVWVTLLVIDNLAYKEYLKRKKRAEENRKRLEKIRKPKEFKWPDNVPYKF